MTHLMACLMALLLLTSPGAAATYDAAVDFSTTSNPTGAWSYGWSSQLTSAIDLYNACFHDRGIDNWSDAGGLPPNVSHNGTSAPIFLTPENITWQAGQLALHPGANGEYSHVLWTAPAEASCVIDAEFSGIDHTGGSTDVHVLHNGISLFDGAVEGYGDTASYSTTLSVSAGDTIDFAVGFGAGGWWQDTTALAATIVTTETGMEDGATEPHLARLLGVYPNPFNPYAEISIELSRETSVRLCVYDTQGRMVRALVAGHRASGRHTETWDGRDQQGRKMASGVYFVLLEAEGLREVQKVALVK